MNFSTIKLDIDQKVATLKIARPEALNALNKKVLEELALALDALESNSEVRVLIITGEGEKSFVAGADIKEIDQLNADSSKSFADYGQKLFRRLETLEIPVIAAVNGFALGGGLELALSCDFIYAGQNAKLGLPEITLGIMPGFGGTVRLARRTSPAVAKELTLTGKMMTADEAKALGAVNKVFPAAELMAEVLKTAQVISNLAPIALCAIKKSIDETYGVSSDQAMNKEATLFSELFKTQDQKEGTRAFIEKRKAQFKGE